MVKGRYINIMYIALSVFHTFCKKTCDEIFAWGRELCMNIHIFLPLRSFVERASTMNNLCVGRVSILILKVYFYKKLCGEGAVYQYCMYVFNVSLTFFLESRSADRHASYTPRGGLIRLIGRIESKRS